MLLVWLFSLVSMVVSGQALTAGELVDLLTHRAERADRELARKLQGWGLARWG